MAQSKVSVIKNNQMDTIAKYLEETEKKIRDELSLLVDTMRVERDTMIQDSIANMYEIPEIQGVQQEPKLTILQNWWRIETPHILPKGEKIIGCQRCRTVFREASSDWEQQNILTDYGRVLQSYVFPANIPQGGQPTFLKDTRVPEIIHTPLPQKVPSFLFRSMNSWTHAYVSLKSNGIKIYFDQNLTDSQQALSKEQFELIGKWQPWLTSHANLDLEELYVNLILQKEQMEKMTAKQEIMEKESTEKDILIEKLKSEITKLETGIKNIKQENDVLKEFVNRQQIKKYNNYKKIIINETSVSPATSPKSFQIPRSSNAYGGQS